MSKEKAAAIVLFMILFQISTTSCENLFAPNRRRDFEKKTGTRLEGIRKDIACDLG